MLQIVTVNAGNYQGRGVEYTNILFDSIRRNLAEGYKGKFVVFTDNMQGYDEGIEVRELPEEVLDGWWNKLSLFKAGVFPYGDRVLYFDLSCVITGRLDEIASYQGDFAILRDFYRPDGLQSSVMAWSSGNFSFIWDIWISQGKPIIAGGDQSWIEQFEFHVELWQDLFPDLFISYKVGGIPLKASVVVCHGNPKPHEIDCGWLPEVWKINGLTRAELDQVCNTEIESYMSNVRVNSERDLPWFEIESLANGNQVSIVGGSPSLKDSIDELLYRQSLGQEIWALNGSFSYLQEQGINPTAHFIIDARSLNLKFIKPTYGVKYFIASQCDPYIFDDLYGFDVTVIHMLTTGMQDYLQKLGKDKPCHLLGAGTTVALKAMLVAELSGYRTMHLYGMDSCYTNSEHHAYEQIQNNGERIIKAIYADRPFDCAPWMITQAQNFMEFAARYTGTITVAGDGFLAFIAQQGVPEIATDIRAREILSRLPQDAIGVEIGVFAGDLSARLLNRDDIYLYMVDSWKVHGNGDYADSGDFHATLNQQQQDSYMNMAMQVTEFAKDRRKVIRMDSVNAALNFLDGSLDFVFIDADHSYEGCKADLAAWFPKVKGCGLISGHDYSNTDFPCFGVNQAVDEFVSAHGLKIELGENFTYFIKKD